MPITATTFFSYGFDLQFLGDCFYCNSAPSTHYESLQEEGGYEVDQIPVCAHCAFKASIGWSTGVSQHSVLMPLKEALAEQARYAALNPPPFGNDDPWA